MTWPTVSEREVAMIVRHYQTVKNRGWVELWAHKASVYWFAASTPIRFITDKEALIGDIWGSCPTDAAISKKRN